MLFQSKGTYVLKTYQHVRKLCTALTNHQIIKETLEFQDSAKLTLETGSYATLASGSALATLGDTSVLVTAVSKNKPGEYASFVPLSVDYRQKYAAAGYIPRNYLRREMAPSEKEILTSRAIDRSIRPLFPKGFSNETQISCQLMAVDGLHDPDIVSINAASLALALSDIPWQGPVGAVRVGCIDDKIITFPTRKQLAQSTLNLIVVASGKDHIVMLEGSGTPIAYQTLMKAIKVGAKECLSIVTLIKHIQEHNGKPKQKFCPFTIPENILSTTRSIGSAKFGEIFRDSSHTKLSRNSESQKVRAEVHSSLSQSYPDTDYTVLDAAINTVIKEVFRDLILVENIRCDGRGMTDLRNIECKVNLFDKLHGSALFRRGQTQVHCTVAFDSLERALSDDPLLEATGGSKDKNFLVHYSFPSFANNELPTSGPVTRREIGHGALAAKALSPFVPKDIPFSTLLMATVMESSGSSSMATVCGGSMALMDAGVKLSSPAAGVAIGLISKENEEGQIEEYQLLTDILGIEDALGDMDLKIAGTVTHISAIQADIKLSGLPLRIIMEAISQSIKPRRLILKEMKNTISEPTLDKETLPKSETLEIALSRRSAVIGPGGTNMRKVQTDCGVQVSWLSDTLLSIFAPNQAALDEAKEFLAQFNEAEPNLEFGMIYTATITEIKPHGVMITLYDNMTPTLLHNSQLDVKNVSHTSALNFEVGQKIKVKYFGRDPTTGSMRVSRRALQAFDMPLRDLHYKDKQEA